MEAKGSAAAAVAPAKATAAKAVAVKALDKNAAESVALKAGKAAEKAANDRAAAAAFAAVAAATEALERETATEESRELPPDVPLAGKFQVSSEEESSGISEGPIHLEVAWEVARKVGGIYTVIRTKAPFSSQIWRDRYGLVGIYNADSAATEFEAVAPKRLTATVLEAMQRKYNCKVHFGRWLIPGYPTVFLFDLRSSQHILHQTRSELMPDFARPGDEETNDYLVFGTQVFWLLSEFVAAGRRVVAHFHEWQGAVGLILAKRRGLRLASVFTTHATLLGRWLCAGRTDLYNVITSLNVDKEAGERQIYHRHWIEREAAHCATVFTTVSEITAFEAEHILGRKVDVIVPNGLNVQKFTALHEFQNLHAHYKDVIHTFIRGHFYGHYDFDLDKTLYLFTAGRHEYFNKGVNVYIDALADLNTLLKREGSDVTVVAFIIMPGKTNNYNVESLKGQSLIRDLKQTCDRIVMKLSENLFEQAMGGSLPSELHFTKEDEVMLKRRIIAMKNRGSLPPIVTHNMLNDDSDEILNHLRARNLFNAPDDRVKVIYHAEFLSSTSPLLPLEYSDFVRACHLGVFPSYYEPWGYTPAECTVLGVPSVTSNLTGFSNFMSRRVEDPAASGIFICDRRFKDYNASVQQMTNVLWRFCSLSRRERIQLRNKTERLSELLDWRNLGKNYVNAWKLAYRNEFQEPLPHTLDAQELSA